MTIRSIFDCVKENEKKRK